MRIAILTQQLRYNFGGILQNYALQTIRNIIKQPEPTTMQKAKTAIASMIGDRGMKVINKYRGKDV